MQTERKERRVNTDKGEVGHCPYCDDDNYSRDLRHCLDDSMFFECFCENCGKKFIETFYMLYQEWKVKR